MGNTRKGNHAFSKIQFRKMHNITKHKRPLSNTKKIRKGGEYINKGSYGIVYGGPRVPCENETYEEIKEKNEVSKIFKTYKYANLEWNAITDLETIMDHNDYKILFDNHAIIPSKMCKIKEEVLDRNPYNTAIWKMNKYELYNNDIFNLKKQPLGNNSLRDSPNNYENYENAYQEHAAYPNEKSYRHMIISERGGDNLQHVFTMIKDDKRFTDAIHKLLSICKGIQILQKNNFIHGDIKTGNCIEHKDTYKLIDMAEVRYIPTLTDAGWKPYVFGYFIYPSTTMYTVFFDDNMNSNIGNTDHSYTPVMNIPFMEYLYNNYVEFNDSEYLNHLKKYLIDPFLEASHEHGFSDENITEIKAYRKSLTLQKTCGITDKHISDIDSFKSRLFKSKNVDKKLRSFNRIFQKIKNEQGIDALKLDIFKRIDIYSFGMMVLGAIENYISKKKTVIHETLRAIIMQLYNFAYNCCIQTEKCADINVLVSQYENIIDQINSNVDHPAKYNTPVKTKNNTHSTITPHKLPDIRPISASSDSNSTAIDNRDNTQVVSSKKKISRSRITTKSPRTPTKESAFDIISMPPI